MLRHERNRGVGAAIRSGIDWAAEQGFDVVVVLGGDDQDDPNEIPRLLEPIEHGDVEFAQGSRRLGGRRTIDMPLFRRVTTKLYSALFRLATGFPSTDGTNGFRAFRLSLLEDRAIDLHQDWLDTYELEPYLFAQGSRRLGGRRTIDMPLFRRVTTKLYSALFRLATGFPSTDGTNGFRAFRLSLLEDRAIDLHQDWLETYELEPYLFAQAIRRGHRVVEVPVTKRYDRHLGYTKMMPGRDWWRILRPLVFLRLGLRR